MTELKQTSTSPNSTTVPRYSSWSGGGVKRSMPFRIRVDAAGSAISTSRMTWLLVSATYRVSPTKSSPPGS